MMYVFFMTIPNLCFCVWNVFRFACVFMVALVLSRLVDLVSNEMNLREKIKEANGGKAIDEKGNVIEDKKRD